MKFIAKMLAFALILSATPVWAQSTTPQRTSAEIEKLIDEQGRSKPDWWDDTPLNYPDTLDLEWPAKPPGSWNNQRNIGQYFWDIINPNPNKWHEGIRLSHALLIKHQNDTEKRTRAMSSLANMYYNFDQDYARAAFWWKQLGVGPGSQHPATGKLAICYWKLGNRQMALDLLNKSPIYMPSIKAYADLGETDRVVEIANKYSTSDAAYRLFLYAGDACRTAGRYDEAIGFYEKVIALQPKTQQQMNQFPKAKERARANIAAIKVYDQLDLNKIPDGTYTGESMGYVGPIKVQVKVASGKITEVKVLSHKEKQCYSAITDTPRQIVEKQGVKGVDAVTGATITSEAIVNAVAKALAGAM